MNGPRTVNSRASGLPQRIPGVQHRTTMTINPDQPIDDPSLDRFDRLPFAQGVANMIAELPVSESVVVAINGAWGEGKTTLVGFVAKELRAACEVIEFNPWLADDETEMLADLLAKLDSAATGGDRKLKKGLARLAKIAKKLTGSSSATADFIARSVSSVLSDLARSRDAIGTAIAASGRRVVVLVDDIDRLDADETFRLFRTIKRCTRIPGLVFVLAYDRDMVADAVSSRFGRSGSAGYAFLEKLVQIPLDIPPVMPSTLRNFVYDEVGDLLAEVGIASDDGAFATTFDACVSPRVKTPREAVRFGSAVRFVLPRLKGELDPYDAVFFEALRTLFPPVYDLVRKHPTIFVGGAYNEFARMWSSVVEKQQSADVGHLRQEFDERLKPYGPMESQAARNLVASLFPAVRDAVGPEQLNPSVTIDDADRHQRVRSKFYLPRALAMGLPSNDISDQELRAALRHGIESGVEQASEVVTLALRSGTDPAQILEKLQWFSDTIRDSEKEVLAITLAGVSRQIEPDGPEPVESQRPLVRLAELVCKLCEVAPPDKRLGLLRDAVERGRPELGPLLVLNARAPESDLLAGVITREGEQILGGEVADNVRRWLVGLGETELAYANVNRALLVIHRYGADSDRAWLREYLSHPTHQDEVLRWYAHGEGTHGALGRTWGNMKWSIDVDGLNVALIDRYGHEICEAVSPGTDKATEKALAREFCWRLKLDRDRESREESRRS